MAALDNYFFVNPTFRATSRSSFIHPLSYQQHPKLSSMISLPSNKGSRSTRKGQYSSTMVRCLFTGIVEEMGKVEQLGPSPVGGFDMKISAQVVVGDVKLGDSIAVNGTCLTVTSFSPNDFTVGLSPETLRRTSLVELSPGSLVNLERAVLPSTRMGGHFVQGHVDGTGTIIAKEVEGDSLWVKVFDDEECFNFMLVAYTQQKVVIPLKKVGQKVNLEVDILGKYVERLVSVGGFRHLS
ncbi:unnamed protein product [Victoria cruziana]